ncbi:hypothetical protein [Halobacterium jilantaiense]|uniref:Uncharacterized protein n=1 Tax=Halobacterium jilantaiense TaxID=355548 RepID=A0A1I0MJ06_9EURY|nr:hypothetical protein [Halobacterium jilantaiense]SEV88028.1 hypothetical protein SAMN04487945_0090 [Halobacterium jilantaiense]
MDDALRTRLSRIERRQRLLVALLVLPNYVAAAELVGYWTAGALAVAVAVLALVVVVSRRRGGNPASDTTLTPASGQRNRFQGWRRHPSVCTSS